MPPRDLRRISALAINEKVLHQTVIRNINVIVTVIPTKKNVFKKTIDCNFLHGPCIKEV